MPIRWLADVGAEDVDVAGGKGASLGELDAANLQVPPGFVVSADTFRTFVEETGVADDLYELLDTDAEDADALADVSERARELITGTPIPDELRAEVLAAYDDLGSDVGDAEPFVAVRSSATAEDLPDSSFAGQQDTYLNVTRADLVDRVRDCWASLFTSRAIYYRQTRGFAHEDVDIAVVVQLMVDAEKSGVMFTRDPSTGDEEVTVEAAWGLGEGVVSGTVSPDTYVVAPDGEPVDVRVAEKETMFVRDAETGETVREDVPADDRGARVLSDDELAELVALADRIEGHYGGPQDVEWAIVDGEVFLLQSRPITTIDADGEAGTEASDDADAATRRAVDEAGGTENSASIPVADGSRASGAADGGASASGTGGTAGDGSSSDAADSSADVSAGETADDVTPADGEELVSGLGASPGRRSGAVRIVTSLDELDKVGEGDVIVTKMTTPDMVTAMQRAGGIVTDEGGLTSHAAIVSRELGLPAVTGTKEATSVLDDGQVVTIDGERGAIMAGAVDGSAAGASSAGSGAAVEDASADAVDAADGAASGGAGGATTAGAAGDEAGSAGPLTATEVKVNVSLSSAAERAAATGADGVGLLRLEHMILETGQTPAHYVEQHGEEVYVDHLVSEIRTVADAFYPRPVRLRTLDAPTDEFRHLEGGETEPEEHNPMLGYRGIRRSLLEPETFDLELRAVRRLHELGYDNLELMFPLVNDADDVDRCVAAMERAGVDPDRPDWGVMIETPAAALVVDEIVDAGVDFVSFGTNDLTQYVLAVDRNNERVADRYDAEHPAITRLIGDVIETCRANDVRTGICGEAGSQPGMVRFLVSEGVTSISANIDAVADVQRLAKRVEQRLVLDSVR